MRKKVVGLIVPLPLCIYLCSVNIYSTYFLKKKYNILDFSIKFKYNNCIMQYASI